MQKTTQVLCRLISKLTAQPSSQPFDFGKIGEVQGETAVTPDKRGGRRGKVKRSRAMCYDADLCNPLTCTAESEREIN